MPTTIQLTRNGFGIELRRGQFTILIDDTDVGSIGPRQTVEAAVEPGHHTLRLSVGRYSSGDHQFDIAENEVVPFSCHGATIWPRYVASLLKPDLAISLRQH